MDIIASSDIRTCPKKGVREYYNKTANQWAQQGYSDDSKMDLLQSFLRKFPEHPYILDLCCGAGYDSWRLASLGANVVGIDLSEESLAIARNRNPELIFHLGDMLDDYSYIGMVDGILCSAGLVHLPTAELRTAFERMAAVVKMDGRVLLVIRDGEGRVARFSDVVVDGEEYDRSFYAHTLEELRTASMGLLKFDSEIGESDESIWKNYIFKRI